MSRKSAISNFEHKLLFIASSIVPILFIETIFLNIYNSYFPPPPVQNNSDFFISYCRFPTFLENAFLISFLACGFLTSIFVFTRHIFHSWLVLFFPLILFILYFTETTFSYYAKVFRIEGGDPPGLIAVFPPAVFIFGGITIFQFVWHTKVVIQDRIRDKKLPFNLP